MQKLNRQNAAVSAAYPERVLQFGGGNFLRAFVDWILDVYNEKTGAELGVLVVKPTERGDYQDWRDQDGLFHILTKGIKDGEVVDDSYLVKSVSRIVHPYREWEAFLASAENPEMRFVISNTTESGIRFSPEDKASDQPPNEFPAKLTAWLYHRYRHFGGSAEAGCIIIPCELLEENGFKLRDTMLQYAAHWGLEADFSRWLKEDQQYCNTLVDRIVPGVGEEALREVWEEIGFEDTMVSQGEPYHLWAIEAPAEVRKELPLDKIGLNVIYTDDLAPYRKSKVRILNGAHTSMVPVGYLYGLETVGESLDDALMSAFINKTIFDEILPSLELPEVNLVKFANDVLDRFRNPFIKHKLISIALNSVSKYRVRVLPSVLSFSRKKESLPPALVFSLSALIRFYKGSWQGKDIPLNDDQEAIDFMAKAWAESNSVAELVKTVLGWEKAWGCNLNEVKGLAELLENQLVSIEEKGMEATMRELAG
ncbi:MAG: tagaturonate reductase [Bacteroidia bacterium]